MSDATQLSILDIAPDILPVPVVWDCMQTCAHMGEYVGHFPGHPELPRCEYGIMQPGIGTSGKDWTEVEVGRFVCRFYKRRSL